MTRQLRNRLPHVLGPGAGGDVEVLGLAAEEQVPDAAADQVGLVPGSLEPAHDLRGVGVDAVVVEGNAMPDEPRSRVPFEGIANGAGRPGRRLGDVLDRVRGEVRRGGGLVVGRGHKARARPRRQGTYHARWCGSRLPWGGRGAEDLNFHAVDGAT